MRGERTIALRRDRWERLGALLERVHGGGLAGLAPGEVREFARLYRETAADLARLRTEEADADVLGYVERLVAGGHNALYRGAEAGGAGGGGIARFLLHGFPALVRRSVGPLSAAAAFWVTGVLLAYAVAMLRPDIARDLCPPTYLDRAEEVAAQRAREGRALYVEMPATYVPLWSSTVVANNVQATFVVFAFGVTAGLGTAALLVFNGMLFGAVAAIFAAEGVAGVFWIFTAALGPVEMPAFLIAGASGLRLGGALLRPGARTRRDALVHEATDAGRLLGGTTVMLVVAGVIEAVVSPSSMDDGAKVAVGVAAGGLVLAWILLGGRGAHAIDDGEEALPSLADGPASVLGRGRR